MHPGTSNVDLPAATHSWARLDGVDILRGLAILFVLLNHVHMRLFLARIAYLDGLPSQLVATAVRNGQHGVQIFFAVSGFLITSTSMRRWGSLSGVSVRHFYALRFARIAPLLLLVLAVLCGLHAVGREDFIVASATGGLGRALIAALTFHINVLEAQRGYLPGNWDVLWSLSVEEVFYLFFPVICWLLGRGRWLVALCLFFVVLGPFGRTALAHGNDVWQEYSYLGGMDAIALGCLTAMASSRLALGRAGSRVLAGVGTVLVALILVCPNRVEAWGLGRSGIDMTILAVGTCLLIAAAARSRWESPRLLLPLMTLGRRSYEIYLTHMFVVFGLFALYRAASASLRAVSVLFIAVIVIAGLLGELVARLYAEPMNRSIRRRCGDGPGSVSSLVAAA